MMINKSDYIISYSFILDQVGYISTSNPTLNFAFFSSMFDGQGGSVRVWPWVGKGWKSVENFDFCQGRAVRKCRLSWGNGLSLGKIPEGIEKHKRINRCCAGKIPHVKSKASSKLPTVFLQACVSWAKERNWGLSAGSWVIVGIRWDCLTLEIFWAEIHWFVSWCAMMFWLFLGASFADGTLQEEHPATTLAAGYGFVRLCQTSVMDLIRFRSSVYGLVTFGSFSEILRKLDDLEWSWWLLWSSSFIYESLNQHMYMYTVRVCNYIYICIHTIFRHTYIHIFFHACQIHIHFGAQ